MSNVPKLRFEGFEQDWSSDQVGNIFSFKQGVQVSVEDQSNEKGINQVRFIRIVDVTLNTEPSRFIDDPGFQHHIGPSDLFMVRYGAAGLVAMGYEGVIANNLFRLIPLRDENVNQKFFFYLFFKLKPKLDALSASSTMPALSFSSLRRLNCKYPKFYEQQKIAAFLTAVDTKIEQLTKKEQLLQQYKKGVMQKLFSQEIRFKADDGSKFPEWEKSKVSALCEVKKGTQLNKDNLTEKGDYPALNGGVSPSGYTENWNTESDTITISEGGNSCGFVNFVRTRFWSGGHNYSLQQLSPNCSKYYLYQYLKFHEAQIMRLRVGSGLPNIQKSDLNEFSVDKPCLDEQSKIASYLGVLDIKIDQITSQLDFAKTFKKGLLQQMFV
jgi:type I restriction enzyme S subunit